MAYVDLNPVRAKMANTPEVSDHTAIKYRIQHHQNKQSQNPNRIDQQPEGFLPFTGYPRNDQPKKGLPFRYTDYLELVDWTGRILREHKRGAIPEDKPEILTRLNLDEMTMISTRKGFNIYRVLVFL